MFDNCRATRKARTLSDHFPLLLEVGDFEWGPSPFRFYNSWLLNPECIKIIDSSLSQDRSPGWAGFVIAAKLRNIKAGVKKWNVEYEEVKNQKRKTFRIIIL